MRRAARRESATERELLVQVGRQHRKLAQKSYSCTVGRKRRGRALQCRLRQNGCKLGSELDDHDQGLC